MSGAKSSVKMRHSSRIDTLELKAKIFRKFGHQKAEKYFVYLNRLFSLKIRKSEFNKLFIGTIGRENISLHNQFISSIVKNAVHAKTPPVKGSKVNGSLDVKNANGYHGNNLQSISGDVLLPSPRKSRSSFIRERKSRDRPSPLGPHGKVQSMVCGDSAPRTHEQQSGTELVSLGSRPPVEVISVEDGEEVDQMMGSPSIQSRSPVRAPLGIPLNTGGARKTLRTNFLTSHHLEACCNRFELPDTSSLKTRLEKKLEKEGLGITTESVNLLNNGLDAFLKRLIKPCFKLAGSRFGDKQRMPVSGQVLSCLNGMWAERFVHRSTQSVSASLLDFRTAMELNPQLLGEDWPVQLERVCLRTTEE